MTIQHEKFGTGEILKSTEQFDEAGNIISADVMFEHGIEQDVQLEEIEALDENIYKKMAAQNRERIAGEKAKTKELDKIATNERKEKLKHRDLHIANHIMAKVGSHIPDSDGFESLQNHLKKQYNIHPYDAIDHLNRAAKKHLGTKSFSDYVDNAMHDYHSMKESAELEEIEDLDEKLKGDQHKIDANKNGKVDAHDFKLLRGKKTDTDESDDDKDDMKEGKISKALTGAAIAATLSAGGMMAKGAHDYHQKDARIGMSQYDLDKMGGKDFTKMKESVEVAPRMTPDSASMRMPAVESVVRDIMSQQRNLRQEAKIAEFKSRNK